MNSGWELYQRACRIIPGGTQLLSKRPELFLPDGWPSYYSRAQGCEVWDLDGRRYIDMTTTGNNKGQITVGNDSGKPLPVEILIKRIELSESGELARRRTARARREVEAIALAALRERWGDVGGRTELDHLAERVVSGQLDPYSAADELLDPLSP